MKYRSTIYWVATLLLAVLAFLFVRRHWEELLKLRIVSWQALLVVAMLMGIRMTLRGCFQWQVMRALGCGISLRETLALNYAGMMMNMVLPAPAGFAFRAAHLKRFHDFPYAHFLSALAALFVSFLAVSCAVGLLGLGWIVAQGHAPHWGAIAILGSVLMACLATLCLPRQLPAGIPGAARLTRVLEGWATLRSSPSLIFGATTVVLLSIGVGAVAIYAAFHIYGFTVHPPEVLVFMASQLVGSLIKITPGALGYQEMLSAYFATGMSATSTQALAVFGMTRVINILVTTVLGLPSVWWLGRPAPAPKSPSTGGTP
ncbi:MAG: lysylphosphatidylglycerol synthase transmembrane domain-containing protein [Planctomycetota bacterium]